MAYARSPFKSNRDFLHDIKFEDNSRVFTVMRTKMGYLQELSDYTYVDG